MLFTSRHTLVLMSGGNSFPESHSFFPVFADRQEQGKEQHVNVVVGMTSEQNCKTQEHSCYSLM